MDLLTRTAQASLEELSLGRPLKLADIHDLEYVLDINILYSHVIAFAMFSVV